MNRFRHTAVIGLVVAALIGLGLVTGCRRSGAGTELKAKGRIKAIDLPARTLVISEKWDSANTNEVVKVETTYRVAYDVKIHTLAKREAQLEDLKVGERVTIYYRKEQPLSVIYKITPRGTNAPPPAAH